MDLSEGDPAVIFYTSGTTGRPKGVELLHHAWTYLAVAVDGMHFIDMDDLQFLWLPLSHVFERMVDYLFFSRATTIGP